MSCINCRKCADILEGALFQLGFGRWWKFSEYEINGGYVTRSSGAVFEEFNPFELVGDQKPRKGKRSQSPETVYDLALRLNMEFHAKLPISSGASGGGEHRFALKPISEFEILEWCRKFGLFGLLLQKTQMVVLSPRYELAPLPSGQAWLKGEVCWRPMQTTYFRAPGGWVSSEVFGDPETWVTEGEAAMCKYIVPDKKAPKTFRPSGALMTSLTGGEPTWRPIGEAWGRYFPSVPKEERECFKYPCPASREFWELYAEPVTDFASAIALIAESAESFQPGKRFSFGAGNYLLTGSFVVGQTDSGTPVLRWAPTSLFAGILLMMTFDLCGDKVAGECRKCGRPFVSSAKGALYCSKQCRWATQKREQRARAGERGER